MSETEERIRHLIRKGEVRISEHGYEELSGDGLYAGELLDGIERARLVENYPEYPKGPCILVLEEDFEGNAVHAVWGIPKGESGPAVLVTAYRPDPRQWSDDFMERKK